MARIGTTTYNPYIGYRRTPNHSYLNSEKVHLTGLSVSASNIYSHRPILHNADCITTKFETSSVNTENLNFQDTRRPFFDDQYSWLRNNFDFSAVSLAKYLGSGTLAPDETLLFAGVAGVSQPIPGVSDSLSYVDWANLESSGWFKPFETSMYGDEIIEFKGYKFALSKNNCGGPNWMTYKTDEDGDRDKDAIVLLQDAYGWGRQSYNDYTIYEGSRQFLDIICNLGLQTFIGLPSGTLASNVIFNPPLPQTYHNPIPGGSYFPAYQMFGVASATEYWPEAWHTHANGDGGGAPMWHKNYQDGDEYHIYFMSWATEFVGSLKGGDAISASPIFEPYWNNPVGTVGLTNSGFRETVVNGAERGRTPFINVTDKGHYSVQHMVLDYGGPGIIKQYTAGFKNANYELENYYNYDCSVNGQSYDPKLILENMKGFNFGFSINNNLGAWSDPRFNGIFLYAPKTKKMLAFEDSYATSAYENDANIATSSNRKFDLNVSSTSAMWDCTLGYYGGYPVGHPSTYYLLTQKVPNGQGGLTRYERKISGHEDEALDSNELCLIYERKNFFDLKDVAYGVYSKVSEDDQLPNPNELGRYRSQFGGGISYLINSGTDNNFGGTPFRVNAMAAKADDNRLLGNCDDNWLGPRMDCCAIWGGWSSAWRRKKGWDGIITYWIIGENKEDVIQKLHRFIEEKNPPLYIDPKDEIPELIYNYFTPNKSGSIF